MVLGHLHKKHMTPNFFETGFSVQGDTTPHTVPEIFSLHHNPVLIFFVFVAFGVQMHLFPLVILTSDMTLTPSIHNILAITTKPLLLTIAMVCDVTASIPNTPSL